MFLAVNGKSNFDGTFTAVTQHDGKFLAVDGFRFFDGNFLAVDGNSNFDGNEGDQGGDTEYPLAGLPFLLVHGGYSLLISEDVVEKQLYYSQSGVVMASDDAALARLFL